MTQHTQPITAESIFYKIFEPQPMIVEGLISKGLTVLGGSPKIGKSWLALDLAISVANGVPFLGKSVQKTGVLYYCLEDTYLRVRNRMHELVDEPPDNLYVSTSSERIGSGFTRDIVSFLRDHRDIDLIIVDTLQKIRGADDGSGSGSYSKDYDEISKLKEIADLNNKSIIAIHHLRQKPDLNDPFNEITGTNGITGVSDTNIVLKRREGSTTAEMYVRGRDVEERKLILEFVDLRWHMLEEKSAAEIEKEKIPEVLYKVADFIKQEGSWFGSASQLQAAINDASIPANQMAKQITRHYYEVFFPECIRFEKLPRKNNVSRTVPLIPNAAYIIDLIRTHRQERGLDAEGYIFCPNDKPVSTYNAIERALKKYCQDLGIEERSPHKERKTFTSALLSNGVSINTTRQLAGHVDERTTLNNYCYDRSDEDEKLAQITYALTH